MNGESKSKVTKLLGSNKTCTESKGSIDWMQSCRYITWKKIALKIRLVITDEMGNEVIVYTRCKTWLPDLQMSNEIQV